MGHENFENIGDESVRDSFIREVAEQHVPGIHLDSELGEFALELLGENVDAVARYTTEVEQAVSDGEEDLSEFHETILEELRERTESTALPFALLKAIHNLTETELVSNIVVEESDKPGVYETAVTKACAQYLECLEDGTFRYPEERKEEFQDLVFKTGNLLIKESGQHFTAVF